MRFNEKTIVADAIKADPAVVDRLIALNPVFRKLQNPILRKTMAKLVNFGDAAKVAGVPLAQMLAAANGDPTPATPPGAVRADAPAERPDWLDRVDAGKATRFDARPLLAKGEEPLGAMMRLTNPMEIGDALIFDAPFDPAPLRRVLAGKGFVSHPEELAPGHWRVTFLRQARKGAPEEESRQTEVKTWREDGVCHVDVRGLEPPKPMLAILELIQAPDTGDEIIVHHEREPMFLYPELDERRWGHEMISGEEGEIRLRLWRNS